MSSGLFLKLFIFDLHCPPPSLVKVSLSHIRPRYSAVFSQIFLSFKPTNPSPEVTLTPYRRRMCLFSLIYFHSTAAACYAWSLFCLFSLPHGVNLFDRFLQSLIFMFTPLPHSAYFDYELSCFCITCPANCSCSRDSLAVLSTTMRVLSSVFKLPQTVYVYAESSPTLFTILEAKFDLRGVVSTASLVVGFFQFRKVSLQFTLRTSCSYFELPHQHTAKGYTMFTFSSRLFSLGPTGPRYYIKVVPFIKR